MKPDPDLVDYLKEISAFPLLSLEEERLVAERTAAGDEGARRTLILSNLRLVVAVAKQFRNYALSFLDLVTEGNYGLIRAADHYRVDKDARFATYATIWIRQAISRALKIKTRQVRIPDGVLALVAAWRKTAARLEQEQGREPTSVEIAGAIGLPVSRVPALLKVIASMKSVSRDRPAEEGPEAEEVAVATAGRQGGPQNAHEAFDFNPGDARKFAIVLRCLTERQATVLRHRYGIDGAPRLTLEEIAARLPGKRLSRERVRQIEVEGLKKVLAVMRSADCPPAPAPTS